MYEEKKCCQMYYSVTVYLPVWCASAVLHTFEINIQFVLMCNLQALNLQNQHAVSLKPVYRRGRVWATLEQVSSLEKIL